MDYISCTIKNVYFKRNTQLNYRQRLIDLIHFSLLNL